MIQKISRVPLGAPRPLALVDGSGALFDVVPAGTQAIKFSVEGGDLRVTFDGTAPTAAIGVLYSQGGPYDEEISEATIGAMKGYGANVSGYYQCFGLS